MNAQLSGSIHHFDTAPAADVELPHRPFVWEMKTHPLDRR